MLWDEKYVGSGGLNLVDVRIETPDLISELEAYSWACDDKMGGGVLNQCGSHVIDILQYLGFRASRVHGTVKTLKKETEKISQKFLVQRRTCRGSRPRRGRTRATRPLSACPAVGRVERRGRAPGPGPTLSEFLKKTTRALNVTSRVNTVGML